MRTFGRTAAAAIAAMTLTVGAAPAAWAVDNPQPATISAAAAEQAPENAVTATLELNRDGSKDADRNRTQQSYQFENADWTGLYIRPGVKARFQIELDTDAANPNVLWAHRQAGRVDENTWAYMRADDGGKLKPGVNIVEYDTTARQVGQVLLVRNDGGDRAGVKITDLNGSLGRYPLYVYDARHPESFWAYVQELRRYVEAGVDQQAGDLNADPKLNMDVTSLVLDRMVYDLRAQKMVDSLRDVKSEEDAVAWVRNARDVSNDRLDYFDRILGFDAGDKDDRQKPTRMKVVLELTQNLTNPSTMFAWFTMYHLPESVWPGVATSLSVSHGWGNDHEYGHMVDIAPLVRGEETNNLISMWGARLKGIDAMTAGKAFSTDTYHGGVLSAQNTITSYMNQKLAGGAVEEKWGDIWFDVTARFNVLHWFDQYDYTAYNYKDSPFTPELATQVNKYGGLGAVYRQVRRNPGLYTNVGGIYEAAARAYSDALGYDMSEVMGRFGMPTSDATKQYTAKYPKLTQRVELYSIDADAKQINGGEPFAAGAPAPSVDVARADAGTLTVTASYPAGSAEAKTTSGYMLLKDGKETEWSPTGTFTIPSDKQFSDYTIVAYDVRMNPSPTAVVPSTVNVNVAAATTDHSGLDDAVIRVTPDDDRRTPYEIPADGDTVLKNMPSATVSVVKPGYDAYPSEAHVDAFAWSGGSLQFTLAPKDATAGAKALRPVIAGADMSGTLAFQFTDPNNGGSDIYYTLDGTEPSNANGIRWDGNPVAITESPATVKAIAYKAGRLPSDIAQASFNDGRKVALYDAIYGPSHGVGNRLDLGVGEYSGQAQLGELYDDLRSLDVPDGMKVTAYANDDFTGEQHTYVQRELWVNGYGTVPSKSIRVETMKAPATRTQGFVRFNPGATDATGDMKPLEQFEGVTVHAPDSAYARDGWTFAGWKDDRGDTVKPGDELKTDGSDITLTALWERSRYTIGFDANGGIGTLQPIAATSGMPAELPANTFTRTGYEFAGWRLPDGTVIQPGGQATLTAGEGETVMATAQWTPIGYKIEFAGDDHASGGMAAVDGRYDKDLTLPANSFTRTGYVFAGWANGDAEYADGATVRNLTNKADATVTLTARWTPITYTIRFDCGPDATGSTPDLAATYDLTAALPANGFTRDGHRFAGWATADGRTFADRAQVLNLTADDGATVTLTALWEQTDATGPDRPAPEPGDDGKPEPSAPADDDALDDADGRNDTADETGRGSEDAQPKTSGDGTESKLAQTGLDMGVVLPVLLMLLAGVAATYLDWRRHVNRR